MISEIIQIVQGDKWHGISKRVEFAKGSDKYVTTWGGVWKYIKRLKRWPKK
jgi:hypothetical protein